MSLDDYVRNFLEDPNSPKESKEGIRALWESHLPKGREYQSRGLLLEAIAEYAKEHGRPVSSPSDAEIVQTSYWLKGRAYKELGDLENAIGAYQKALELFRSYRVGSSPHQFLAEIFIEQGRLDEAIEVCQELLETSESWTAKQLLMKAKAMRDSHSE